MRPRNHIVPLAESQQHIVNAANSCGACDDSIENRLHVGGRPTDNPEHLGRCCLMLQGLAQFCVAFLQFLEQPDILDGDDSLVSEGFKQSDVFF